MTWRGKTYWIVGASEGLGRALAHELHAQGAALALSARNEQRLGDLASDLGGAYVAPLDVRDAASVRAAFATLPPLDGVIYAAGVYEPMGAHDWDPPAVEAMCDVNFTGAARVFGEAVPALVRRGGGHIVTVPSARSRGCAGCPTPSATARRRPA